MKKTRYVRLKNSRSGGIVLNGGISEKVRRRAEFNGVGSFGRFYFRKN